MAGYIVVRHGGKVCLQGLIVALTCAEEILEIFLRSLQSVVRPSADGRSCS